MALRLPPCMAGVASCRRTQPGGIDLDLRSEHDIVVEREHRPWANLVAETPEVRRGGAGYVEHVVPAGEGEISDRRARRLDDDDIGVLRIQPMREEDRPVHHEDGPRDDDDA